MGDNPNNNNGKIADPLANWNKFKLGMLLVFSVLLWLTSMVFSYIGFINETHVDWYFKLFAIFLTGAITALELHLTSQTFNFEEVDMGLVILWAGGLAAYCYGIYTNVIGLSVMMIGTATLTDVGWQTQVIPIIAGFLLEALPEPMFIAFLKSKRNVKSVVQKAQEQAHQNSKQQQRVLPDDIRAKLPPARPQPMPPRVKPELSRFRSSR